MAMPYLQKWLRVQVWSEINRLIRQKKRNLRSSEKLYGIYRRMSKLKLNECSAKTKQEIAQTKKRLFRCLALEALTAQCNQTEFELEQENDEYIRIDFRRLPEGMGNPVVRKAEKRIARHPIFRKYCLRAEKWPASFDKFLRSVTEQFLAEAREMEVKCNEDHLPRRPHVDAARHARDSRRG